MARTKRPQPFRPPPWEYDAGTPESSLCYALIDEGLLAGWDYFPEYPNNRYDILFVAGEGCTTAGAEPGMQIGVQAKMKLNDDVLAQVRQNVVYHRRYNGPDRVVALVPEAPRTPKEKEVEAKLQAIGAGIFFPYLTFNGNDSSETRRAKNFDSLIRAGQATSFPGRIPIPKHFPLPDEPGKPSPTTWSLWKQKAMALVVHATVHGTLTHTDFAKHRVSMTFWRNAKWILKVGQQGRSHIYELNPDVDPRRPDAQYPELFQKLVEEERARTKQEEGKEGRQEATG